MLSVPAAGAVAAAGDRITGGSVAAVALLRAAGSEVIPVARHVALVAGEAHATLTLAGHRVTDGVASTLAVIGAVLAVATASACCHHTLNQSFIHTSHPSVDRSVRVYTLFMTVVVTFKYV